MKQCSIFSFLLTVLISFGSISFVNADHKLKAVTSFTIIADMVRNIAGDKIDVVSITKPGAEIHDYQPSPKDIVRAKDADIIFYNGLNLERWFKRFLKNIEKTPNVIVSEGVEPLSIYEGDYKGKPNPHAWMSPNNALTYIENIRKALVRIDPKNTDFYNSNAKSYSLKIIEIKDSLLKELSTINNNQRYLVSSEGAFSYLAKDFNLTEIYLWPVNADQQGTPQQVRSVIDKVRKYKIPVVFSESTISNKPIKQVSVETGAAYGGVLYVDSLSTEKGPVPTYIDLLEVTCQTIANGFINSGNVIK